MAISLRNSKKKTPPSIGRRRFRARIIKYRRPLAVICAVIAALCLARIAQPPAPSTIAVIFASRDIPAGAQLAIADLKVGQIAQATAWDGIATDKTELVGTTTAHAISAGAPIDQHSIVGPTLLDGLPFTMRALNVLINPATEHLISTGDHVDLLFSSGVSDFTSAIELNSSPGLIASDVVVLATSGTAQGGLLTGTGRAAASITIAATAEQSLRIAQYSSSELVVALRNASH